MQIKAEEREIKGGGYRQEKEEEGEKAEVREKEKWVNEGQ